jgi:hypothetical protein
MEVSGLLYPQGNRPQYLLDRRLGGPKNWSGCCGEKQSLVPGRNASHSLLPFEMLTELF